MYTESNTLQQSQTGLRNLRVAYCQSFKHKNLPTINLQTMIVMKTKDPGKKWMRLQFLQAL